MISYICIAKSGKGEISGISTGEGVMADAAMLLVEALYQLRSSIDALAQDQAQARENAFGQDFALSIVNGLSEVRGAVDKLAADQASFQHNVVSILTDISRAVGRLPEHIETLDSMAHDVSLIADRYRPFDSDLSPNLDD